jgi:hypothetical protein
MKFYFADPTFENKIKMEYRFEERLVNFTIKTANAFLSYLIFFAFTGTQHCPL